MITLYTPDMGIIVNVPPVVKIIGYIRYGGISIDATFDLSSMHPSQHELALRVICMVGGKRINEPWKAPEELLPECRPWWKFWK